MTAENQYADHRMYAMTRARRYLPEPLALALADRFVEHVAKLHQAGSGVLCIDPAQVTPEQLREYARSQQGAR